MEKLWKNLPQRKARMQNRDAVGTFAVPLPWALVHKAFSVLRQANPYVMDLIC
jgi:hypothetical protein